MRLTVAAQTLVLLLPAAALGCLGWERRWVAEDAFIDLRVVQHILAGYGPVFNVGERVEIYTNPLWVGMLAAAAWLLSPLVTAQRSLEWIAVVLGLTGSVVGLSLAILASVWRLSPPRRTGVALPLGGVVVAAIPAYWDFVTSGLETGLTLGWLGLCFWMLTGLISPRGGARWTVPLAVLIGLGPLIRPDLTIVSAGFLLLLLMLPRTLTHDRPARWTEGTRPTHAVTLLATAAVLPGSYQLFRMGYFGALVPNTALAKEAGAARWDQGWWYLADFAGAYWLWIPTGVLFGWWLLDVAAISRRRDWRRVMLLTVPALFGLLHAAYVVRVGGDFMHGRMLLPSTFAVLLPVAGVTARCRWPAALPAGVVITWAIACALWLRAPYYRGGSQPEESIGKHGIADERGVYVRLSREIHPVMLADYAITPWARDGHALRAVAKQRRALLPTQQPFVDTAPDPDLPGPGELPLVPGVGPNIVVNRRNIGLTGYAAGARVHVVDSIGLGDPIAGRLRLERRGRPGHEKALPQAWMVARFAPAEVVERAGPEVRAARDALGCGDLAELLQAVAAPLDPARFFRNITLASRLSRLRIPAGPEQARAELCRAEA